VCECVLQNKVKVRTLCEGRWYTCLLLCRLLRHPLPLAGLKLRPAVHDLVPNTAHLCTCGSLLLLKAAALRSALLRKGGTHGLQTRAQGVS